MNMSAPFSDSRDARTVIRSSTAFLPAQGIVASAHDDGMLILDTVRGRLYELCAIGCEIWLGLTRGLMQDTIALEIANRWDACIDVVTRDVAVYIDDLHRSHLLVKVSQ